MTVLWRDDYMWLDRPLLSPETTAFWQWLDAALDTLNGQDPEGTSEADRLLTTVALVQHANRSHPCLYRADDLAGPCLPGRLVAAELQAAVSTGYDEAWSV